MSKELFESLRGINKKLEIDNSREISKSAGNENERILPATSSVDEPLSFKREKGGPFRWWQNTAGGLDQMGKFTYSSIAVFR